MRSRPLAASNSGTVTGETSERLDISRSFLSVDVPKWDHRRKGRQLIIAASRRPPRVSASPRLRVAPVPLRAGGGDVILNALLGSLDLRDEILEVRRAVRSE